MGLFFDSVATQQQVEKIFLKQNSDYWFSNKNTLSGCALPGLGFRENPFWLHLGIIMPI